MLDSVAAAQVNDGLERIRRQVAGLEESVRILDSNGAEAALKQSEWARAVVALDNEHLRLYLRATDSLQEDAARHQLVLERLRQQNEQNEKQAEGDLAELAEIQESIAELRKTLAALPTKQLHQKRTIDEARMRLEKHLKSMSAKLNLEVLQTQLVRTVQSNFAANICCSLTFGECVFSR